VVNFRHCAKNISKSLKIARIAYNMKGFLRFSIFIFWISPNLTKYTYGWLGITWATSQNWGKKKKKPLIYTLKKPPKNPIFWSKTCQKLFGGKKTLVRGQGSELRVIFFWWWNFSNFQTQRFKTNISCFERRFPLFFKNKFPVFPQNFCKVFEKMLFFREFLYILTQFLVLGYFFISFLQFRHVLSKRVVNEC
jgi:hypothetical protein